MRVLGLTGDIASGKSTVARHLAGVHGALHLDSDALVRELYADPAFVGLLCDRFGADLNVEGEIDRARLGALVWHDQQARRDLEALVHPRVAERRDDRLEKARRDGVESVVLEAVLLLESGGASSCDEVWCVVSDVRKQERRLVQERGLSLEAARKRLLAQPDRARKLDLAASTPLVWIANDGSLSDLLAEINRRWREFIARSKPEPPAARRTRACRPRR